MFNKQFHYTNVFHILSQEPNYHPFLLFVNKTYILGLQIHMQLSMVKTLEVNKL